jgi:probable F420-dependent oxidoreductase
MALRFGVSIATCSEGMMYPVPFASPDESLRMARLAESLGYDSVWGNDHMTTQRYVRDEFPAPPNFYDLLMMLCWVAARTTRIRVGTSVLVIPLRHVVVAAKQAATLDQLSGGRLILGVGVGAYREEYEALFPDTPARRGVIVEEGMQALRRLFTERRVTFEGRHVRFRDVECFPKPLQRPLPIWAGGNAPEVRRRAGELADGWLPAVLSCDEIRQGVEDVRRAAERAGRDPAAIEIAPQFVVSIGRTREEALRRFRASQLYKHLESLKGSTLRGQTGGYEDRNLIGSPAEICERIEAYRRVGVTSLPAIFFVANTVPEILECIELFGREVIPEFA